MKLVAAQNERFVQEEDAMFDANFKIQLCHQSRRTMIGQSIMF